MRMDREKLAEILDRGIERGRTITLKTYYLSDYGEMVLHMVTSRILARYDRSDLNDVVYTAAKELIINATKANLKRLLFARRGLSPDKEEDYDEILHELKHELTETRVRSYRPQFIEYNYPVLATFYYTPEVLNIKVKNSFTLYPQEEKRIRQKFEKAESFSSLLDFYLEHGDDTEGAGLGLTMVGILLDQSGIDRHSFTLSSNKYNETAAKLEIPLNEEYIPRRQVFDTEVRRRGLSPDELRRQYKPPLKSESQ